MSDTNFIELLLALRFARESRLFAPLLRPLWCAASVEGKINHTYTRAHRPISKWYIDRGNEIFARHLLPGEITLVILAGFRAAIRFLIMRKTDASFCIQRWKRLLPRYNLRIVHAYVRWRYENIHKWDTTRSYTCINSTRCSFTLNSIHATRLYIHECHGLIRNINNNLMLYTHEYYKKSTRLTLLTLLFFDTSSICIVVKTKFLFSLPM